MILFTAKLLKIYTGFLSKPVTIARNNSLKHGIFHDKVKMCPVVSIDKGKPNKSEISNYGPVGLLSIFFSKAYKNVKEDQLLPGFKNCFFFSFLLIEKFTVRS